MRSKHPRLCWPPNHSGWKRLCRGGAHDGQSLSMSPNHGQTCIWSGQVWAVGTHFSFPYKTEIFVFPYFQELPKYNQMQPILIIHKFYISRLAHLLKFTSWRSIANVHRAAKGACTRAEAQPGAAPPSVQLCR